MKRYCLGFLLLSLCLAVLAALPAAAEGDWEYEVTDGAVILTRYTGSETEVVIPEEIDGIPVRVIGSLVIQEPQRYTVNSVSIPDSVISIRDMAFAYCEALESVRLPAGLAVIRDGVFTETGLKRVELPAHVLAIERNAFRRCRELEEIVFPDGLELIGSNAFKGCEKLRKAVLPDGFELLETGAFQETDLPEDFAFPAWMNEMGNPYRYWYRAENEATEETKGGIRFTYVVTEDGEAAVVDVTVPENCKKLVFPEKLGGHPVTGIYGTNLTRIGTATTIQLPKSLRIIGSYAFRNAQISKIVIPDGVKRIGAYAFEYCRELKEIKLPAGLEYLGYNICFQTQVDWPELQSKASRNGAEVQIESRSEPARGSYYLSDFTDGDSFYQVILPEEGNPDRSVRLQYMRSRPGAKIRDLPETCRGLPVEIGDGSNVPDNGIEYYISHGGERALPVRILDADSWDGTFPDTALGIPVRTDTYRVDFVLGALSYRLYKDDGSEEDKRILTLTGIDEEHWDGTLPDEVVGCRISQLGPGVRFTEGDMVFGYVRSMIGADDGIGLISYTGNDREVTVPAVFLGMTVKRLDEDAFAGLPELETLHLPGTIEELRSRCIHDCPKLTAIDLPAPSGDRFVYEDACQRIGAKYVQYNDKWNKDRLVSTAEAVKGTGYALFADGTAELRSLPGKGSGKVKIPEEVDGHTVVSLGKGLFGRGTKATGAVIPDTVEYIMSECFYNSSITEITVPGSVKVIAPDAFASSPKLKKVKLNEGTEAIGNRAFRSCYALTEITLPDTLAAVGERAFEECAKLKEIRITGPVTEIGTGAFYHCQAMTAVTLPDTLASIGEGAFADCRKLKKITIPEGVTEIGPSTFSYCSALSEVNLSSRTARIGEKAFYACRNLKEIDIPEGAEVHKTAFEESGVRR